MRLIDADALKDEISERQYFIDGVDEVYNAIDNVPTVEERPTGKYQKRALELINTLEDADKITVRQVGTLRRAILAEPDRPTGEWVEELTLDRWVQELPSVYYCSRCRSEPFGDNLYNYCPNCGAKMKGEENND